MNPETMPYDEINIKNLEVFARHGVFSEENRMGQKFLLNLTMYCDTRPAGTADLLERSISYGEVCAFMTRWMQENTCKLIEAVAEHLCEALLHHYPTLAGVTMELKKPWAPIGLPLETVSVKITRFWHTAYICLGSNMGDKKDHLDKAVSALNLVPGCKVKKVSTYLVTKPYGGVEQEDFLNACLILKTVLPPEELLEKLHKIEQDAHRERDLHWGPRTLDLDILMYDDLVMESDDLIIPHVEMPLREFVLKPLMEIAPNKRHPILKKTVTELFRELSQEEN